MQCAWPQVEEAGELEGADYMKIKCWSLGYNGEVDRKLSEGGVGCSY
jgi:hypothetical protein